MVKILIYQQYKYEKYINLFINFNYFLSDVIVCKRLYKIYLIDNE